MRGFKAIGLFWIQGASISLLFVERSKTVSYCEHRCLMIRDIQRGLYMESALVDHAFAICAKKMLANRIDEVGGNDFRLALEVFQGRGYRLSILNPGKKSLIVKPFQDVPEPPLRALGMPEGRIQRWGLR